jgi:hypothetical protein
MEQLTRSGLAAPPIIVALAGGRSVRDPGHDHQGRQRVLHRARWPAADCRSDRGGVSVPFLAMRAAVIVLFFGLNMVR